MTTFQKAVYVGIDPGLNGGITTLDDQGKIVTVFPMPVEKLKDKVQINFPLITSYLSALALQYSVTVGIEIQHAMTKQGVSSTFKTAYNYGHLLGIVMGLDIKCITVRACEWQTYYFGKRSVRQLKDTKENSIYWAQQMFPDQKFLATPRCTKLHDGMTDSCLIAYYIYPNKLN